MVRIREINGLPVAETQDLKNNVGEIPSGIIHQKTGERILIHALPMTSCVYRNGKYWLPCVNTILYTQGKPTEHWEGSV